MVRRYKVFLHGFICGERERLGECKCLHILILYRDICTIGGGCVVSSVWSAWVGSGDVFADLVEEVAEGGGIAGLDDGGEFGELGADGA